MQQMLVDNIWGIAIVIIFFLVVIAMLMVAAYFFYPKMIRTVSEEVRRTQGINIKVRSWPSKRIFDICVSLFMIIFIMSWLWPIISILIKLDSKGPILYKQRRYTIGGRSCYFYRFRTMKVAYDQQSSANLLAKGDTRITKVGHFLRLTSMDSLPMIFNVLFGDASVVGLSMPSSFMPNRINVSAEFDTILLNIKPGVISLFSISLDMVHYHTHDYEKFDIYYANHQSMMFDLKILLSYCVLLLGLSTKNLN